MSYKKKKKNIGVPYKEKNHQGSKGSSGSHSFQVFDFPLLNAKYAVSLCVFYVGFDFCASCLECKKL